MKKVLSVLFLLIVASVGYSEPKDAVVRIPSHGGSGTIIATGQGWTLVLSCAHCFEGVAPKPIVIDMPHPSPGSPSKVGIQLIACGRTSVNDLSLVKINSGPMPYVTPVMSANERPSGECWSVGYDEMKMPAQCRPAKIVRSNISSSGIITTDARPWHGRSGGGLIDKATGKLIGVCSAYSGPSNHKEYHPGYNGIYVSHETIVRFLVQNKVMQEQPQLPSQPFQIQQRGFDGGYPGGNCPGGNCPQPFGGGCPGGNCPVPRGR